MTKFRVGDVVRSDGDYQGLRLGTTYRVHGVDQPCFGPLSCIVAYRLVGDDGRSVIVHNAHLLLTLVRRGDGGEEA